MISGIVNSIVDIIGGAVDRVAHTLPDIVAGVPASPLRIFSNFASKGFVAMNLLTVDKFKQNVIYRTKLE